MSKYSVADAKNRLPELIDRAIEGEDVIITRHGHPVVELSPIPAPARRIAATDLDWIAARRVGTRRPADDAGKLVSKMRDEWDR
jgi:prevent-host-death family protein